MKIKDIKEKILKRKLKITPLIMALTLTLGALIPVVPAEAKEVPVYATCFENGSEMDIGFTCRWQPSVNMSYRFKGTLNSNGVVFFIPYVAEYDSDNYSTGFFLFSSDSFSLGSSSDYFWYKKNEMSNYGSEFTWSDVTLPDSKNGYSSVTSDSINDNRYYRANNSCILISKQHIADINDIMVNSFSSHILLTYEDYGYMESFDYDSFYLDLLENNFQIGTETASGGLNSDLTNGSYDSSLGYLANLKLENYNLLEDDKYPVDTKYVVTWDNTRDDFDDTYKVAHYVKVHATFQLKKDLSYTSERIWVNDALYTDCKSSFVNSEALTSSSEYQSFIEEVEVVDKKTIGTYVTEYEHNLIIYKETDSGIKYGFWNVLKLDKYGEGYVGSYLIPSYGIEDSEGNYVAMESGKPLGSFTYGQGGTFEEAENNSQVINSPIDGDGSDDLFATIEQYLNNGKSFIGNFPNLMGDIFENMPPHLITMITIGLGLLLALRLFGR